MFLFHTFPHVFLIWKKSTSFSILKTQNGQHQQKGCKKEQNGYGISMGLEYFQKFLDKPIQKESDFGGR